jgi:hydrogenase nickel incorporation protein HypA/HybF
MHEMDIACSVLDAVGEEVRRYPGRRASRVELRVGKHAGVDPESLRFCFEAAVQGAGLAPLALAIHSGEGHELEIGSLELDDEEAVA